ncbi:unnamed protein product [Rotaria sordida]|uniref:G-protein coupled receptors family 1 profile domain-containing protein n=1 Tax=Rotaria sordida TaxID=392033 RepID=A0A818FQ52_9BILA|nr:unnamed protein product [Rotaria sordida]CAF1008142.1 unnamed protein product [Rotaria sordida]CAF3476909.1 unnamed protein product [Rotaria sordida]CAF3532497.1 unnamed protein product [Rotaria sordida]
MDHMMTVNDSNATTQSIEWIPGLQLVACIFYSIILLVGVTGNILVIVIVMKYPHMRNATNYLLTNLSAADLFLLLFCTADGYQHLYGKDKHRLGNFMCRFSPFVQNITATCSVLTIMAISYERYVAICQPLKTNPLHLTLFRTLPTVVLFWFVSCLISIPFFTFTNTDIVEATYDEFIISCFTRFPLSWATWYLIPCTLIIYLIILIMLCYWHYSICCMLFNRESLLRDNTIVTRYRRQVAQLLIALIVSFFVLILPHKIWGIIQPRLSLEQFHELGFRRHSFLIIVTRSLLYLNSAINPILYSIMSTKFRQSFSRLCGGCDASSKGQHASAVLFCNGYSMRPILISTNRDGLRGTVSTTITTRLPYHSTHISQLQEKKTLLTNNTPTPVATSNKKFIFP